MKIQAKHYKICNTVIPAFCSLSFFWGFIFLLIPASFVDQLISSLFVCASESLG